MEKSNKLERSELWNTIYNVVKKLPLKNVDGDSVDAPSAATEIENIVKNLPIKNNVHFTNDDVDASYILGVFNASGIDGLSNELKRMKEIGLKPHQFLTIIKNEECG